MNSRIKKLQRLSYLYRQKQFGFGFVDNATVSCAPACELPNDIGEITKMVRSCHLCSLSKKRRNALPAVGCGSSGIMIVLDSPNANEDEMGAYYLGKAGDQLKKMITGGMQLDVDDVYLTSAIKCFTQNSEERQQSLGVCKSYLQAEIIAFNPKVILALGQLAFDALVGSSESIIQARGKRFDVKFAGVSSVVIPSYTPSFLLLNPSKKKESFEDLKMVLSIAYR